MERHTAAAPEPCVTPLTTTSVTAVEPSTHVVPCTSPMMTMGAVMGRGALCCRRQQLAYPQRRQQRCCCLPQAVGSLTGNNWSDDGGATHISLCIPDGLSTAR